ncbi:hypothetical protein [Goodfellowiella coeruleoviolacea]|uniref:Uncharacterized protein n=1 Tax=Goodfellowiella coeruleoviolacea TaxID=334858 RepID=A0AAE3KFL6_9PSEU|nr:hypothetical protein [Goodfellowiella coeruleoviolacea]MCP2166491.1 hypothetical protein [Goodfellowiella coeruleoviolacea]
MVFRQPGMNRPTVRTAGLDYDRADVAYVLGLGPWTGWGELLGWLRGDGVSDPRLTPDRLRRLWQDAEAACGQGMALPDDPDRLWSELRQARTRRERS